MYKTNVRPELFAEWARLKLKTFRASSICVRAPGQSSDWDSLTSSKFVSKISLLKQFRHFERRTIKQKYLLEVMNNHCPYCGVFEACFDNVNTTFLILSYLPDSACFHRRLVKLLEQFPETFSWSLLGRFAAVTFTKNFEMESEPVLIINVGLVNISLQ